MKPNLWPIKQRHPVIYMPLTPQARSQKNQNRQRQVDIRNSTVLVSGVSVVCRLVFELIVQVPFMLSSNSAFSVLNYCSDAGGPVATIGAAMVSL